MPIEIRELVIKAAIESGAESIAAHIIDGSNRRAVNTLVVANGVELARKLIVRGLPAGWNGRFLVQGLVADANGTPALAESYTPGNTPAAKLQREMARGGLIRARVQAGRSGTMPRERAQVMQAGRR